MRYFDQALFSFLSAGSFAIILNAPRRVIFQCGLIGSLGWLSYKFIFLIINDLVISNFFGSAVIGLLCIVYSKKMKTPILILKTPAIVPLVPGGSAYLAVRFLVERNYLLSLTHFINTLLITCGIVLGFIFTKLFENRKVT